MALDKILVVGKDTETHNLARAFTGQLFAADDMDDVWQLVDSVQPHLILLDTWTPHEHICSFLRAVEEKSIDTPVVIIDHVEDSPHAETILGLGAFDYIKGKADHPRLTQVIDRIAKGDGNCGNDEVFFSDECPSCVSIVGRSEATAKTLRMTRLVADSSCNPVLIVGETGTGK